LRILRQRGIAVRMHLTIDDKQDAEGARVMRDATAAGTRDLIVNHGESSWQDVIDLYRRTDVFIFPSVCESFGFPQVEAMAFGLPVICADTPINNEICRYAALYFPPDDAARLASLVERLYQSPGELANLARMSARRALEFSWIDAAQRTLDALTLTRLERSQSLAASGSASR
jgi:glycosyltransferase involved in cell wall biosynthesis